MLYIYRVYKKKASCVYGRAFTPNGPFPGALDALFRRQIVFPKALAMKVAAMIQPFSEEVARVIEAYPLSYHHAGVQEIGIGLALDKEKWESDWPSVYFEELTGLDAVVGYTTLTHEWTVTELADRRAAGARMPRGMDKKAWRMLAARANKKMAAWRLRKKMEAQ